MSVDKSYILIAEDDEEDKMLLEEALDEIKLNRAVHFVSNGQELVDFLNNLEKSKLHLPELILLDLNMPKKDGREALDEIKQMKQFKKIPIIVLSTSTDKEDIEKIYTLGGNSFISKPNSYTSLIEIAKEIKKYWLELVRLPNQLEFNPN